MAIDYTTFLQMVKAAEREERFEDYINARLTEVDAAVGGYVSISVAGLLAGNYDLTPTQARHRVIVFTGNPAGAQTVRIPSTTGAVADPLIVNACGGSFSTLTIKSRGANAGNAPGVSVATGHTQRVRHDGESAYYGGAPGSPTGGALSVPACRVYHSANQSVASGVPTILAFNSERYKTVASLHNNATNNSRLVAPSAGVYRVFATVLFHENATGHRSVQFYVNGSATTVDYDGRPAVTTAGAGTGLSSSTEYYLSAGSYVECVATQSSGAPLNVLSLGNFSPEFGMSQVSGG